MRRPLVKRLLIALLVIGGLIAAAWFGGRYPLARWAIARGLSAAGLQPFAFQVDAVGFGELRIANLSVGTRPWLQVNSINVAFTLRDLFAGRVATVRVDGVRWTVDARNAEIDWGYVPETPSGATRTFDLPCDRVELTDSAVHVVLKHAAHDVQLGGWVQSAGRGTAHVELNLSALGRQALLKGKVASDDRLLTIEIDGRGQNKEANSVLDGKVTAFPSGPPALATGHAQIAMSAGSDTSMQIDLALNSITESLGSTAVMLAHAEISAQATLGQDGLRTLRGSLRARDLRTGDISLKAAELKVNKVDGPALEINLVASGKGWELPDARGRVGWKTTEAGPDQVSPTTLVTFDVQTHQPISVELEAAGITGDIQSVVASARVERGASGMRVLEGRVVLDGGSLQAGDLALSEARAEVLAHGNEALELTSFRATVNEGSTVSAEPFTWRLDAPRVQTRVTVNNLSLAHWLPIITNKRATGEGRVSGDAQVGIDWSSGTVKVTELSGALRADPEHGFIQVADAESLGELLEKQDPRFATDEVMQAVRDKIISALRDFAYRKLTVALSRRGDRTVALTYLSGFGRHGEDPQGINLTLDLHVQDAFLDLAARIAAKSRIREAARGALDEFFQGKPAAQENPR